MDGDISVFSNVLPDFSALAMREHLLQKTRIDYLSKAELASYIVFDIPYIDGKSIMDRPLSDRKNILKDKLKERIASRLLNPFPKTERLITAPPSRWAWKV